jgi:uncharacterized protein
VGATAASEPSPPDPRWPRCGATPFPRYRFVPGRSPHPRRPGGHAYAQPELVPALVDPELWRTSEAYLASVDLYNFAYWWEAHEVLEGLWKLARNAGRAEQARFFQGVIQVAAANLKRFLGAERSARALADRGLGHLASVAPSYMGVCVVDFSAEVRAYFTGARELPALIRLEGFGRG